MNPQGRTGVRGFPHSDPAAPCAGAGGCCVSSLLLQGATRNHENPVPPPRNGLQTRIPGRASVPVRNDSRAMERRKNPPEGKIQKGTGLAGRAPETLPIPSGQVALERGRTGGAPIRRMRARKPLPQPKAPPWRQVPPPISGEPAFAPPVRWGPCRLTGKPDRRCRSHRKIRIRS